MTATAGVPQRAARVDRVPAEFMFVVGAVSVYVGSALAVGLFDRMHPVGVASLRIIGAATALVVWRRPWRATWTARRVRLAVVFGLVTTAMNTAFYLAIEHLPLGTTVAIEFLGPVLVGAAMTRSRRGGIALAFAAGGVLLVSGVQWEANAVGVLWALAAAALWMGYIVLGDRVAGDGIGLDGLALGTAAGAAALAVVGAPHVVPVWNEIDLLALGLLVGLFSNSVPYALDQLVLRRLSADRFALLLAILPVMAVVVGAILLAQVPTGWEAVGIALVVAAIALRDRSGEQRASVEPG